MCVYSFKKFIFPQINVWNCSQKFLSFRKNVYLKQASNHFDIWKIFSGERERGKKQTSDETKRSRTERFRTSMIQEIKGRRGERAKLENVSVHLCFWKTKVRDYSIPKENALTIQKTINFLIIYMWACLICHPPMIPRFKLLYYERKEHWKNQKIKEWKDKKTSSKTVNFSGGRGWWSESKLQ